MKKTIVVIMIVVVFSVFYLGVMAAPMVTKVTAYINAGLKITFNGELFEAKETNGEIIYPIIYDNRTYLPVRALCDLLETDVVYDQKTSTVALKKDLDNQAVPTKDNLSTSLKAEEKDTTPKDRKYSVSGKVLLPNGEVAPKGGISGDLFRSNSTGSAKFLIPEGESQAEYFIDTNKRTDSAEIGYNIRVSDAPYIAHAYYSSSGTTNIQTEATKVPVGSENIDIMLMKTERSISGTITFTNGAAVGPNGKEISVQAYDQELKMNFHRQYLIPEGTTQFNYLLNVFAGSKTVLHVTTYRAKELGRYEGLIDTSAGNASGINVVIDP